MYKIIGVYKTKRIRETDVLDEFETLEEARQMLAEYRLAYGDEWYITIIKGESHGQADVFEVFSNPRRSI